ncbi:MAG: ABC transporter ATP-binding protein [Dermatophilaceae bacterium]
MAVAQHRAPEGIVTTVPAYALQVDAARHDRGVRIRCEVPHGSVTAVVGPNGSGKSSLIKIVSGQLRPDEGTVAIDGRLVSGPGVFVPVHRRRVALLEQRPLLFEHLDVLDNVAFGPRALGVSPAEACRRARTELQAVGCLDLASNRSWEISGGQAQRISLARALATDPRLVLLDEPMAALDVSVSPAVRALLRERIRGEGRTALMVTHDIIDALSLADTLLVIDDGGVADLGPVEELLARPRTPFLADLVGVNLLAGKGVGARAVVLSTGERVAGMTDGPVPEGVTALASFEPSAVAVHLDEPTGSPRNHLRAQVVGMEPRGTLVRLTAALGDGTEVAADLTVAAAVEQDLHPGRDVWLAVKAVQVSLYPR